MGLQSHKPESQLAWSNWLQAARNGSCEALGQLLDACRKYLLLVANAELNGELRAKGGASDLVQETFVEAQRDFPAFQGTTEAELRGWLRQMLRNNIANFTRKYRESEMRQMSREVSLDDCRGIELSRDLCTDSPSPGARAIQNEEAKLLEQAVERLPAEYRQAVLLRSRERLSFEEIGRLLGRSSEAARKLWARAVERLRCELNERLKGG